MIVRRRKEAVTARKLTTDEMVEIDGQLVPGKMGQWVVRDRDEKMLLDDEEFQELYELVGRKPKEQPAQGPPPSPNPADPPSGDPQRRA